MASVASEAVETEEGGSGECDEGEYVPSVPSEIVHEYKYTGRDGTAERTLEFGGVDMKGLVDLTTFGKVTGEALWPCSGLLADHLSHDWKVKGEGAVSVLELGCGLGLCGAVCAAAIGRGANGENVVVLTDGDPGAVERAIVNAKNNYSALDAKCRHSTLCWGDEVEIEKLRQGTVRGEGFDMIIASDIVYDEITEEMCRNLLTTVDRLLSKEYAGAQFLISFQLRSADITKLHEAFRRGGYDYCIPTEGEAYEDMFGNRHDEMTMFTDKYLISYTRRGDCGGVEEVVRT